jgi:hypothetical protein
MSDLFLSYAREDRECAESFAGALKNRGWTVWWDRRIQVGRSFSAEIERELDAAPCVLVLWSRNSVASEWVQNEAAEAARRKVLVPVRIEDVRPPLEFRRLQAADLFDWRNGFKGLEFEACLASIEVLAQRDVRSHVATLQVGPQPQPDYWIYQGGKQFHAPDIATLVQWAKEGRVNLDSQIYDVARKQFTRARDVEGLRGTFDKEPKPPSNEFWVNRDGKQSAVHDIAALRKLAEEGGIDGETSVYDRRLRTWVFAKTIPALDGVLPMKALPPLPVPTLAPALVPTHAATPVSTPQSRHETGGTFDKEPKPPSNEFWVNRDGKQVAVHDIAALRKLAEEGGIDGETSVYNPRLRTWVFARTIPALDGVLPMKALPPVPGPATAPALVPTHVATPVSTPQSKHETGGAFDNEPKPPSNEFWVNRDGKQVAVHDIAALRKLAEEGGIDGETSVYDPRLRTWMFARTIPALDGVLPMKALPSVPGPATAPALVPTHAATPVSTPKSKHETALPSRQFTVAFTVAGVVLALMVMVIMIVSMNQRPEEPTTDTVATDTTITWITTDTVATANTDTVATDTTVAQAATTIVVSLTNACKGKTVSAAIAYVDTTGTWVSHGWYILAPGETKSDLARATNHNVYFYGMSGKSVWHGNKDDALKHPIPVNKTVAVFGGAIEQLTGAGFEKVSFFGRNVPVGQTTWTQPFLCD